MTSTTLSPTVTDFEERLDAALAQLRAAVLECEGVVDLEVAIAPPRALGGRHPVGQGQIWWRTRPEGKP